MSSQSFRKDLLLNSTDWKSREHTDTHVSSQSFVKAFTVKQHRLGKAEYAQTLIHVSLQSLVKGLTAEQHRLEKQRTNRNLCVIAILWKGFTVEQSKWRSRERTDYYFGSKPSKRSYRKQQDTRKWTIRVGGANTVQAQEEHAKKQQHTPNKYRITLTASSARGTL